ncbi:MAG: O-antigen ligase family protein [Victivallales bacterium]|nr:O-antigen ligase family protein [Victivallales bacterium]
MSKEKFRYYLHQIFHLLECAALPILCLGLAVMPLCHAGGERWWLPILMLFALASAFVWLLARWWNGSTTPALRLSPMHLLYLIPIAVGTAQLWPNDALVAKLSPKTSAIWRHFNELALPDGHATATLSLSLDGTRLYVFLATICLLVFTLVYSLARHRRDFRLVLWTVVTAAVGNAIWGFIAYFQGNPALGQGHAISGTFINRNHFAFLMMLGCMAAAALIPAEKQWRHGHDLNAGDHRDDSVATWQISLLFVSIFLMLTAQVLSLSRGAVLGALLSLAIYTFIRLFSSHSLSRKHRQKILALTAIACIALACALPWAMTALAERYEKGLDTPFSNDLRWHIWKCTVSLIRDFWPTGVGLGAYGHTIQPYETGRLTRAIIEHAHNDYLELVAEIGLPLTILLLVILLACWIGGMVRAAKQQDATRRWLAYGALLVLPGVLLHEAFDFNLHAWPNAVLLTALLAVGLAASRRPEPTPEPALHSKHGKHIHRGRFRERLPLPFLAILIACVLLPMTWRNAKAGLAYAKLRSQLAMDSSANSIGRIEVMRLLHYMKSAKKDGKGDHQLLARSASVQLTAAKQLDLPDEELQAYCQGAFADIIRSCTRAPQDPATAIQLSHIMESANALKAMSFDNERLSQLYAYALECAPNLVSQVRGVAFAEMRRYIDALLQGNRPSANQHKENAIQRFAYCLSLNPKDATQVFGALTFLEKNYTRLVEIIPPDFMARRQLLNFLIQYQRLDDAMHLTDLMLAMPPEELISEESRDQRLLHLLRTRATILELEQKFDQRTQALAIYWNKRREFHEKRIQDCQALVSGGHYRKAESLLNSIAAKGAPVAQCALLLAQIQRQLGRQDEITRALLPLAYDDEGLATASQLQRARQLLPRKNASYRSASFSLRTAFLEQALHIRLAEIGATPPPDPAHLKLLEEQSLERDKRWLQRHLIPLYLGRLYLLLKDNEKAYAAFHRCLDECPTNLFAIRRLPSHLRTQQQAALLDLIERRRAPVARLSNALLLMGLRAEPAKVQALHEQQSLTYLLLCTNDMNGLYQPSFLYSDKIGTLFRDTPAVQSSQILTWRVGELIEITREWQPLLNSLGTVRRTPANGLIIATTIGKNTPRAQTAAFTVELPDAAPEEKPEQPTITDPPPQPQSPAPEILDD